MRHQRFIVEKHNALPPCNPIKTGTLCATTMLPYDVTKRSGVPARLLDQIRSEALAHLDLNPVREPLGGLGIFHCRKPQKLREIPILQPFSILVVSGEKRAVINGKEISVLAGELLLLPSGFSLWMENIPDPRTGLFLSLGMGYSTEAQEQFKKLSLELDARAHWKAIADEATLAAFQQWLHWCSHQSVSNVIATHRQVEFLLLLAQAGIVGNLLLDSQSSWKQKVSDLLSLQLARDWRMGDACQKLAVSESSLRRYLQRENSSFREILEETRLVNGLGLVLETCWPIGRIAESVGYQSQSRFSDRFKQRFGLSPSTLRRTQMTEIR